MITEPLVEPGQQRDLDRSGDPVRSLESADPRHQQDRRPAISLSLRDLMAFEMIDLISLQLGAGEHTRAEETQRDVLQQLRQHLADLDALTGTDRFDRG